jgi:hypothetical protein
MLHKQRQEQEEEQQHTAGATTTYNITPDKIESLIKDFKTHRCTLVLDRGFITATMISSNSKVNL